MTKFLRTLALCFFILSLVVLTTAYVYRMMRNDRLALEAAWMNLERVYEERIETVIDAEPVFTTQSGQVLIGTGFAKKTRYQLRFESDKTVKVEAINRFENELGSVYEQIKRLELPERLPKLDRFLLLMSVTESSVLETRERYNLEVRRFNAKLTLFPRNWFAGLFNHQKEGLLSMQIAHAPL